MKMQKQVGNPVVAGATFRWNQYCRVLKARGVIADFSKTSCLGHARKLLDEDIAAGRVIQIKRGEYELT
jgi:hypothetical protein